MNYLVYDCGLYANLAAALTAGGKNKVWYFTPIGNSFPAFEDYSPGLNFMGLEKVKYFWDYVDKADCIVAFDVSNNDMIDWLRRKYPEKSVFGAGLGERLENDRVLFKKVLEDYDLPVVPYKVIKGFKALEQYFKTNKDKFVKVNIFRGDWETMKISDWEKQKQVIYDRIVKIGLDLAETIDFIVEDMIEAEFEIGFDGFFNGTDFQSLSFGVEMEKNLYLGRTGIEPPKLLMETLDKLQPLLAKMNYRGSLSTEERVVSNDLHYFIDPCCRVGMPLGTLYSKYINNWPELVYAIGKGEYVDIECDHKYVAAYALETEEVKHNDLLINIDKGHEDDFRFMTAYQDKDKKIYAVKGLTSVAVAMGAGNTPDEALENVRKNIEFVHADGIDGDSVGGAIEKMHEAIKKFDKLNIDF